MLGDFYKYNHTCDHSISNEDRVDSSSSHNLVLHIHYLCLRTENLVSKESQISLELTQLYWKYKAQKLVTIQQSLIQKVMKLLSNGKNRKRLSDLALGGEVLHLVSLFLEQETTAMCIKADLLEKWKELLHVQNILSSERQNNLQLKMIPPQNENRKNRMKQLLEEIKLIKSIDRGNHNWDKIIQGLQILVNSMVTDEEPFLFYSSINEQVDNVFLQKNERFFYKLIVNGTVSCISPIGRIEECKGKVNFDLKHYVHANGNNPRLSIEIFKSSFMSPPFLISRIFVTSPRPRFNSPLSRDISTHLLPPISLWYHFRGGICTKDISSQRAIYAGYLGVSTYYIRPSTENPNECSLHFLDNDMIPSLAHIKLSTTTTISNSPSFVPLLDRLLNFRDGVSGRLFVDGQTVAESKRHQLLRARSVKFSSFSSTKGPQIAIDEVSIGRLCDDDATGRSLVTDWKSMLDSVSVQRPLVHPDKLENFLKCLYTSERCSQSSSLVKASDIIFDIGDTRMSGNLSFLWLQELLCPSTRRSLFPMDLKNRNIGMADLERPSVIITIVTARNIPSRSYSKIRIEQPTLRSPSRHMEYVIESNSRVSSSANGIGDYDHSTPIFQVQFRGDVHYSQIVSRKIQYFKQTLAVALLPDNESLFTPQYLFESEENIEMKLFDVFDHELTDGRDHHFLGALSIPLKYLYGTGKLEGTFRLDTPEILIGYEKKHGFVGDDAFDTPIVFKTPTRLPEESSLDLSEAPENFDQSTYLDVAVNVYPPISYGVYGNETFSENAPTQEDTTLVFAMKKWLQDCQGGESRWIRLMVTDLEGYQWMIARYIRRLSPPHSVRKSMRQCSHFVSLISLRSHIDVFRTFSGRVSSCQQCIDIQSGDEIEHAILLTNFFLHISKKRRDQYKCTVFLVFGRGHFNESVVMVGTLMKDGRFLFWDALKGDVYSVTKDSWHPIIEVSNLVTEACMYLNLQRSVSINDLSFDFDNKKTWSCFPSPSGKRWSSVQPASIYYSQPDYKAAAQIESEVGTAVRQSISIWRGRSCEFRDDVSDRLVGILEELEDIKLNGRKPNIGYFTSISSLIKDREIFGFPLHFAYTNVKDILGKLEKTEIHKSRHPQVEFAVSVRVFPYESKLMSVWVFICSLSPITSSPPIDYSFLAKS